MQHASFSNARFRICLCVAILASLACKAGAQQALQQVLRERQAGSVLPITTPAATNAANPPTTVEEALRALAAQSAVICVASVVSVQADEASVAVSLQVEEGIVGVSTGATYLLREWQGTWSGHADRYRVGQRALFLLHAPSAAGYSSPVGGADGIVPIAGDRVSGTVDLRWLGTHVLRTIAIRAADDPFGLSAAPLPMAGATTSDGMASCGMDACVAGSATGRSTGTVWNATVADGDVTGQNVHAIDRDLVTGLLRAWTSTATPAMAAFR